MAYAVNDKIHVNITGTVGSRVTPSLSVTNQISSSRGYVHFLYLGSKRVQPITEGEFVETKGTIVRAEFDAKIAGPISTSPGSTTKVKEIVSETETGYVHYVYLDSDEITPLDEVAAPQPAASGTGRISPADDAIESTAVRKRIAELEDSRTPEFLVTRSRTGNVEYRGKSALAASRYLDENDLIPERFTVTEATAELSGDDATELEGLRKLNERGQAMFGPARWITEGVLLHAPGYFDESWAKTQAVRKLSIGRYQLDEWPLVYIDRWDEAARQLRDADYRDVLYNGQAFWGSAETGADYFALATNRGVFRYNP